MWRFSVWDFNVFSYAVKLIGLPVHTEGGGVHRLHEGDGAVGGLGDRQHMALQAEDHPRLLGHGGGLAAGVGEVRKPLGGHIDGGIV